MSQPQIRAALRQAPDGLTVTEIAKEKRLKPQNVLTAVKAMPDVYVDRWIPAKKGCKQWTAIYIAVEVPENAPMPD